MSFIKLVYLLKCSGFSYIAKTCIRNIFKIIICKGLFPTAKVHYYNIMNYCTYYLPTKVQERPEDTKSTTVKGILYWLCMLQSVEILIKCNVYIYQ